MSSEIVLLIIFIAIEVMESSWQKADTLYDVIYKNYYIYRDSLLLYFVLNSSFFFSIFLVIYLNNHSFWLMSILVLKFIDIALRLSMIKRLDDGEEIESILPVNMKMTNTFRYLNVIIYPVAFIFAII